MNLMPCPYDDQIRIHHYNSTTPEAENLRGVNTTHSHLLPHMIPRLFMPHTYNHRLSDSLTVLHHDEVIPPPPLTHLSYSFFPVGSESPDDILIDCRDRSPQPFGTYSPWGSFHPPPNLLPNAAYGVSPSSLHNSIYRPTLDPTLYSNSPCRQSSLSAADIRVSSVDEYIPAPSHHHSPATPLHTPGASLLSHVDYTSAPYGGPSGAASYPCQWTEGGIICDVMVQATRSHMNRHLHAYHGFGAHDTQQTRCHWARCKETMQQGSIARHMVTCHLQAKVTCPMCFKKLSRQDVISKHQRVCPAASIRR